MRIKFYKLQKGFTLIELLIVVAIIGILSALLTANFIGVRERARDGQRKSDLRQIQSALELYRADIGSYPVPGGAAGNFPSCGLPLSNGGTTIYMQKVPCDPSGTSTNYTYSSGGSTYSIIACLENGNDSQADKDSNNAPVNCTGSTTLWRFTVQNQ